MDRTTLTRDLLLFQKIPYLRRPIVLFRCKKILLSTFSARQIIRAPQNTMFAETLQALSILLDGYKLLK